MNELKKDVDRLIEDGIQVAGLITDNENTMLRMRKEFNETYGAEKATPGCGPHAANLLGEDIEKLEQFRDTKIKMDLLRNKIKVSFYLRFLLCM